MILPLVYVTLSTFYISQYNILHQYLTCNAYVLRANVLHEWFVKEVVCVCAVRKREAGGLTGELKQ